LETTDDQLIDDLNEYASRLPEWDYLITTRLDNDDAYRKDVIDIVQRNLDGQEFEFLNFYQGYQLSTETGLLYLQDDKSSPFATLIESKSSSVKTVMFEEHQRIASNWPVRQIGHGRCWVQVIHGGNVANACRVGKLGWLRHHAWFFRSSRCSFREIVRIILHRRTILKAFYITP
jgi:hypothetical protein